MDGVSIFAAIVIGVFAGWIAEQVMHREHGLLTNLVVGVVGALLGGFMASLLGFGYSGFIPSLVVSTIGAIALLAIVGMFRKRRAL
jgi:uncharacterized membrane protein YeaQ/YmgE (transglycosylase-associated protein family)